MARVTGAKEGAHVEFELEAGFPDAVASLEDRRYGIQLVASRRIDESRIGATVYVPRGRLGVLEQKIERYQTKTTSGGRPRHERLVATIDAIRLAALESFWTDTVGFPDLAAVARWELWVRDETSAVLQFEDRARAVGIELSARYLVFPERRVYLARCTAEQLAASIDVLDALAELRLAKDSRVFFTELRGPESRDWAQDLLRRVVVSENPSSICLLDSGLNSGHPLLEPYTDVNCVISVRPEWGANDQRNHGSRMAGLSLFGDLTPAVASSEPVQVYSRLESVKLLPPPPAQNPQELYGVVTRDAVSQIEIAHPDHVRTFSMTITSTDSRDRGQASAWSAEIDRLAFGADGSEPRLFILSAGNSEYEGRKSHPTHLETDLIHDPGQAWNALTVGACTSLWQIEESDFSDWKAVADVGDLSPSTTTSLSWSSGWPLKPDIVCEGGNCATDSSGSRTEELDSLSLLTTSAEPVSKLFTTAGDTSAACAVAARIAGAIRTRYPQLWPETVRALVVQSAEWTETMRRRYGSNLNRAGVERLIRFCGYGEPSLDRALWSASNDLTLIAEAEIQPFQQEGRAAKLNEMHLHRLPWPIDELRALAEAEVELSVTLSYFVEPNPARRGWIRRHRYASHGLRFEIQTPLESVDQFRSRINQIVRGTEEEIEPITSDTSRWLLGPKLRSKGSVHRDVWRGSAAELSSRQHVAVFPVGGWWKERPQLGRADEPVRYSLILAVKTPQVETDLYTPIANAVRIPTIIET